MALKHVIIGGIVAMLETIPCFHGDKTASLLYVSLRVVSHSMAYCIVRIQMGHCDYVILKKLVFDIVQ